MGICLDYSSRGPADAATKTTLFRLADILFQDREWGRTLEYMGLAEHANGILWGSAKMHAMDGLTPDEDPEYELPGDMHVLIDHLCRWSEAFGITWDLSCEDEEVCTIDSGKCDRPIDRWLLLCD